MEATYIFIIISKSAINSNSGNSAVERELTLVKDSIHELAKRMSDINEKMYEFGETKVNFLAL